MPQIVLVGKSYNERRNRPSLIGNASGPPIGGRTVPTNNNGGRPFDGGGNMHLGGDGGDPPGRCNNRPLGDQNPRSYVTCQQDR